MSDLVQGRAGIYGRQSRGKAKSIAEQLAAGVDVAAQNSWTVVATYQDGTSASRYARKSREAWQQVLADIDSGALDVLVLWESSRGDRNLTSWSTLLDLCRDKGVSFYIISDERLYDPRKARDWKTLASAGVDSAGESDLLSVRVLRGQGGAAKSGRPSHGRCPFGYKRVYDPDSGALVGQEPDPETAPIVREIFERLGKGEAISAICDDFNARQVRTCGAQKWYRVRVRDLALNVAYIAVRTYNGNTYPATTWPALVDEATFYRVQRILGDVQRVTTRPGRAVHLLSYLAVCHLCGADLCAVRGRYRCQAKGCVTIVQADMDAFVTAMVLARLEQPDVYEQLRKLGEHADREVVDAENEIARLNGKLAVWRKSAANDETTPESLAVIEADLTRQIRALEHKARLGSIPPELRQIVGTDADVRSRWEAAPLPAKRRSIEHIAQIRVDQAALPGSRHFEFERLGMSRWTGDDLTWGDRWSVTDRQ